MVQKKDEKCKCLSPTNYKMALPAALSILALNDEGFPRIAGKIEAASRDYIAAAGIIVPAPSTRYKTKGNLHGRKRA
jgi:hypothetical protein